eukprot:15332693-Ditylum_brightwellii.AAC.1
MAHIHSELMHNTFCWTLDQQMVLHFSHHLHSTLTRRKRVLCRISTGHTEVSPLPILFLFPMRMLSILPMISEDTCDSNVEGQLPASELGQLATGIVEGTLITPTPSAKNNNKNKHKNLQLHETWLDVEKSLEADGFTLIYHELTTEEHSCWSFQGVAIALSLTSLNTWAQSGMTLA